MANTGFINNTIQLPGTSSGAITIQPQAAAGTYNFNLPTTAGTSGYFLTSAGGGSSPMTWTAISAVGVVSITATAPLTANGTSGTAQDGAVTIAIPTPLPLTNGGTNASLTASNGGIFYSTATAGAILAGTATANQVLLSGSSTTPAWSTATYPATTTVSQLLYSSSANVISGLTTANDGVLVTNNTGVPSWLANSSTAGYVLTANSGAAPSWQATATTTGNRTLISSQTASSSASIVFTSGITGYSYYELEFLHVVPATNTAQLQVQFSTNGGSSYVATGYANINISVVQGSSVTTTTGSTNVLCSVSGGQTSSGNFPLDGLLALYNLGSSSQYALAQGKISSYAATSINLFQSLITCYCSANQSAAAPINAISVSYSSGNIASGVIRLFGIS